MPANLARTRKVAFQAMRRLRSAHPDAYSRYLASSGTKHIADPADAELFEDLDALTTVVISPVHTCDAAALERARAVMTRLRLSG
jgi:hypothetical protein